MTRVRLFPPAAACLLAVLASAAAARAAYLFTAALDGPTAGSASAAVGTASLVLNDARTEVAYEVILTGLEGVESASHFHYGEPGALGPRLLTLPPGPVKTGVWPVDAFALDQLESGRLYINVHTDLYPTGELRGDIGFVAVPDASSAWGAVKALFR